MLSIQTNVNSLVAQQNLSVTSLFQSKTIAQLTSGYRINQSGDDAAGLAVANKFRSTVAELTQGVANGNDATAQLQIMDGGMSNISMILDRLKTLATQSASGTFTGNRSTVNAEFQNDLAEIDRQAQSIGLNSGGLFARNLDVYLGTGSGSQTLQNGVVTLGLTQSSVDSQALGMKGMQAANVVYAADGTNSGTSIGSTSTTSVQAIVGNTSGANPNQEATAGYAAFQFSGAGFSDGGKGLVSVNLAGVTDTTNLVAAINAAIQTAGNGITAASTAFKNANIVASVHTDSAGGQELAFSSSTSAFQVQAGDQMANALLGHVGIVGDVAQGTAIAGTAATNVTGVNTTNGLLTQGQTVKLVITGGGLASPVTMQVNTSGNIQVSTSAAISDLETQFSGNALLTAAGLSMAGSSTPGSQLSFASAVGQGFNIQVTGDTANLLGLGSFSADSAGNADYTLVTAGAAYDATAITGNSTTTGAADVLEVSLNGAAATGLTAIDLTAGAHALAASLTSSATITGVAPGNSAGTVDITAANRKLNVTVINNGAVTNAAVLLDTNTIASQGAATSTVMGGGAGTITISSATTALNNSFMVAVDGGAAVKITLDDGPYTRAEFLTEVQDKISGSSLGATVTAGYADLADPGDGLGALTLTSAHTAGVDSTVKVDVATTATRGTIAAGTLASSDADLVAGTYTVSSALHNDKFMVSKNGATAVEVTIAAGTNYDATTLLAAISGMPAGVTASWDALNGDKLTLTSNTVASSTQVSSVAVSAATYASKGTVASTLATMKDDASFVGFTTDALLHNNTFTVAANGGTAQDVAVTGTYSADKAGADAFLIDLNSALGGTTTGVTAGWDAVSGELMLTSNNAPGALSSVVLGAATYASQGTVRSTLATMKDDASFAGYTGTVAGNNNMFTVTKDGGVAKDVTLTGSFTADKDGADQFLIALNTALGNASTGVTAGWDAATGNLTLTSGSTGALSSVAVGTAHYVTSASAASATVNAAYITGTTIDVTGTGDNKFNISVDGGASEVVTVGTTTYNNATTFVDAVQSGINSNVNLVGKVTAGWDTTTGFLTLTAVSTGDGSSITASAVAANTLFATLNLSGTTGHGDSAATNSGLTSIHLNASTSVVAGLALASNTGLGQMHLSANTSSAQGSNVAVNGGLAAFTLDAAVAANGNATHSNAGLATMGLTGSAGVLQFGATDGAASVASIALQIQNALGIGNALVTVSNDYKISIESKTKGANSSVMLNNTANSAYATLHLTSPVAVLGLNSSIADVVDNLNAQFAANGTAYQAAGLKAVNTQADGTVGGGNGFITIQSNNSTQFRLNAVGLAATATHATQSSTVTEASFSATTPLAITLNTNDKIDVSVNGLGAHTIQVAASLYTNAGVFVAAVQAAIDASVTPITGLAGKVTAGWDSATNKLTLTSVATGTAASVTTSATSGNTGIATLGFGAGATSTGQLFSTTENTGFGVAGTSFTTGAGAVPSSTGTSMSAFDAFGTSNSTAFTFSAMKYGSDKQALTFSATDSAGTLETQTITLQNKAGVDFNRAGVSIDTAVAYINQQLQKSTSNPALQKIVAVKEVVGGAEQINFVSSLANFTVGVAATANGDGLNAGVATQKISATNGAGANMSVDTQAGGQAAVTALAVAIAKLGSAQAAVGKGQNQLAYAVNLAQSQITNFSAAESQIRDANVAQQAANLSKAQVLSQASIAAMAQANSAPQAVLSLLRG